MFPPKLSDEEIREVIRELTRRGALPSGALLRRTLSQRFRCKGGVARIYRLLDEQQQAVQQERDRRVTTEVVDESQASQLLARALLAEEREVAHQVFWAKQIDELRTRVAALEPLAEKGRTSVKVEQIIREQLRAAYGRIAQLEDQVLALQQESLGTQR